MFEKNSVEILVPVVLDVWSISDDATTSTVSPTPAGLIVTLTDVPRPRFTSMFSCLKGAKPEVAATSTE
jgi:hypothetical protein